MTSLHAAKAQLRVLLDDTGRRPGSAFEQQAWPPRGPRPDPSGALYLLSHLTAQCTRSAGSLYYRLRPILHDVASHRLRSFHGVDLDTDPTTARLLLGDALYEIVRSDAPPPEDRRAPGLPLDDLAAALARLENL